MDRCADHPWQPTHACFHCGRTLCVLCLPASRSACAECTQPAEEAPPWEAQGAYARTLRLALTQPRRLFARMTDGEVGNAWTFAALCCLAPRLLIGVLDGRGGPLMMLMRALVSAAVQAASATFFLGSAHFLFVLCVARANASWRISARSAGYAQAITMVIGLVMATVVLLAPGLRESRALRDVALLASAGWYTFPLYWVGRERLRLSAGRALFAALATSFGVMLALRALT